MLHDDAVDLIQHFVGCSNVAYACPAHISNGGRWPHLTIGYGHSGPEVHPTMTITTAQARDMLARDLANVEAMVRRVIRVRLSPAHLGAVCSLAFNMKPAAFERSQVLAMLNAGEWGQFSLADSLTTPIGPGLTSMALAWAELRYVGGRPNRALAKLRSAELELFFEGQWSIQGEDRVPQAVDEPQGAVEALMPGARSDDIVALHEALAAAGFPVTCGDAYTWVTSEAVRAFQRQHGLDATGHYDAATASKLEEVLNGQP